MPIKDKIEFFFTKIVQYHSTFNTSKIKKICCNVLASNITYGEDYSHLEANTQLQ